MENLYEFEVVGLVLKMLEACQRVVDLGMENWQVQLVQSLHELEATGPELMAPEVGQRVVDLGIMESWQVLKLVKNL